MLKMKRRQQAVRFIAELDRTASLLAENPCLGAPKEDGTRGLVMTGFPYTIYYVVKPDVIVVAAIAHHSRQDGYWRKRLDSLGL